MVKQSALITVGVISKPHNLQGTLKIFPITDFPERFLKRKEILVENQGRLDLMQITDVSLHQGYILLNLLGIDNLEKAEGLRGAYLKVAESQLETLEKGHYYIYQLVGLQIKDQQGNVIGILEEILKTGANDVYVVKTEAGKEILIPALKKIVKKIDIDIGEIIVELQE